MMLVPILVRGGIGVFSKHTLFLANHIDQRVAALTNSTNRLSLRGIQQSINHKSSMFSQLKEKPLWFAIHDQIDLK